MPSQKPLDLRKPMRPAPRFSGPQLPFGDRKPRMPLRARRRRARLLLLAAFLVLAAIVAWGISYVSYLPRFTVSEITVSGAQAVSADDVQRFVQNELHYQGHPYLSPDNIFLLDTKKISRDIALQFPLVKSARLSRPSFFGTDLSVGIVERQPYAFWCSDASRSDCYQMDDSGFLFEPAGSAASSSQEQIFTGGLSPSAGESTAHSPIGQLFAPSHLPGIEVLLQALGQAGFTALGASVSDSQDLQVPLAQGFYLKASFGEDPQQLVSNLQLILTSDALKNNEAELEYVDLRFGDKVYYKLLGQSQTSASSSSH